MEIKDILAESVAIEARNVLIGFVTFILAISVLAFQSGRSFEKQNNPAITECLKDQTNDH